MPAMQSAPVVDAAHHDAMLLLQAGMDAASALDWSHNAIATP
jgi:hypothetical protein